MQKTHGPAYPQADEHLARLAALGQRDDDEAQQELARLQRDVLLFDVDRLLVIKRHEINASHVYTYHYEGQQNGGGLYVVRLHEPDAPPVELVASPDGQILDCDLSYDGTQVLFSWRRKTGDGYHLWTVNIDGSGLKQLTDGPWHDYNGCWLPDGGIAFLSTRAPQFAYCWHAPVGILHRMAADGSNLVRLSANYLNDFTPCRAGRRTADLHALGIRRPAGDSDPEPVDDQPGRHGPGRLFRQPRAVAGHVHGGPADPRHDEDHLHHDRPQRPDARGDRRGGPQPRRERPGGDREHHARHAGAAGRQGQRQHGRQQAVQRPACRWTRSGSWFRPAARSWSAIWPARASRWPWPGPATAMQYFCATPVRPRTRPPVIPSRLPTGSATQEPIATLYLQDVYKGLEPTIQRGEVKAIRVVRELQKTVRIDPELAGVRLPVPGDLLRGDLRGQGRDRRSGREPGRLGLFPRAVRRAAVLHGLGQGRPGGAADAQLHALDARRSAGLRRLPRIAARFAAAAPGRPGPGTEEAAAAGVGQRRV